jgi:hypothetical protein
MVQLKQNLITVAPGVYIDPLVRTDIDTSEEYILLDAHGFRRLGLTPSQDKMLRRLEYAGRIKTYQITPRRRLLKLSTWRAHLREVEENPEFWEGAEIQRRWRAAKLIG